MRVETLIQILFAASPIFTHTVLLGSGDHVKRDEISQCDTKEPDESLRSILQELNGKYKLQKVQPQKRENYNIDTYMHFVVDPALAFVYSPNARTRFALDQVSHLPISVSVFSSQDHHLAFVPYAHMYPSSTRSTRLTRRPAYPSGSIKQPTPKTPPGRPAATAPFLCAVPSASAPTAA